MVTINSIKKVFLKTSTHIMLCFFLFSCGNLSGEGIRYEYMLLDGSAKRIGTKKRYYAFDSARTLYVKSQKYCSIWLLFIPLYIEENEDFQVFLKFMSHYKQTKPNAKIDGMVDVHIDKFSDIGLGFVMKCKRISGVIISKEELDKIKNEGEPKYEY